MYRCLSFVLLLLTLSCGSVWADEWVWQADKQAMFTDGVSKLEMNWQGSSAWCWDDPYPGVVTFRQSNGWMAGDMPSRGFANSSDFGEAFDIDKGITVAARVWPVHAHSHGTLCLSAANSSTRDLPGKSTYVWVGWAVPDEVRFYNTQNKCLKQFRASVDYDNRWSVWTFSAKQIGDTVAWDLWIDKVHQGADQVAPDGTEHTLVYTEASESGNKVRFGQRHPIAYPHETAWDYVAITNDGVIPGWSGNTTPAQEPEQPKPLTEKRRQELLRLAVFKEYMKSQALTDAKMYTDVLYLCDAALAKYSEVDPGVKKSLWFQQINALTQIGQAERAVQLCDEVLAKYPDKFDAQHLKELLTFKIRACRRCGMEAEAARVIQEMQLAMDSPETLAAMMPVVSNPDFEETAEGNDTPGWTWHCRASAMVRSVTTDTHSGSRCVAFTNASEMAPEIYARFCQQIKVYPLAKYEINLWVRGDDVSPGSHLTDWKACKLDIPEGTYGWRKVSAVFTTQNGQKTFDLGINIANKCTQLAIDDISLRLLEAPADAVN